VTSVDRAHLNLWYSSMNFQKKAKKEPYSNLNSKSEGVGASIEMAFELFRKGRLGPAQDCCRTILARNAENADVLNLLGMVLFKQNQFDLAVKFASKAIGLKPRCAQFYRHRGISFYRLNKFHEALHDLDQAVALDPSDAAALELKAETLLNLRRREEALDCFDILISADPDNSMLYQSRGNAYSLLGQHEKALNDLENALQSSPKSAELHNDYGSALGRAGEHEKALDNFDAAISLNNDFLPAYVNKGDVLQALEQFPEAIKTYQKAIDLEPFSHVVLNNLGNTLNKLGQHEDALKILELCFSIAPDFFPAIINKANALDGLGRYDEAKDTCKHAMQIAPNSAKIHYNYGTIIKEREPKAALKAFNKAISLDPNYFQAFNNKANLLRQMGRLEEAVRASNRVINFVPPNPQGFYNRGNILQDLHRFRDSVECYRRALELKPDYLNARWNLSLLLIRLAEFEEGWSLYECRWDRPEFTSPRRGFLQPLWLGHDSLKGRSILLHSEQGLGDSIQFSRFARQVSDLAAEVFLEVPSTLADLLKCPDNSYKVIEKGENLPNFDFHCPLMSLPAALKTLVDTIPYSNGYLSISQEKKDYWLNKISKKNGPRIGIVWSGSEGHKDDDKRSIRLKELSPLFSQNANWISLQKEIRGFDKPVLASMSSIQYFGEELIDFTDTAALCELMDLIITVDTSVAHLAGALGKPTWLMVAHLPDYRWLQDRTDTPWYDSVRLFRQKQSGNWTSLILEVRDELIKHGFFSKT